MADSTIRRAIATDAKALSVCINAAYAPYAEHIPDLPDVAAGLDKEIIDNQVWVAELSGQIIGGLVLVPSEGFLLLANIAVHPDNKGTGLGGAFMALAEQEAKRQGFHELRLSTHKGMPDNVRIYEHLGWELTEISGTKVSMKKTIA